MSESPREHRSAASPAADAFAVDVVATERGEEQSIASARLFSKVLDDLIKIPGTRFTIGADGLLGLVPGVGDAATTAMAGVIMVDAMRLRVPLPVLGRMALNLLIDAALGQLPGVGDVADFAFRSNRLNLRLLERTLANRERTALGSTAYLLVALGLIVATLLVLIAAIVWTIWLLFHLLGRFA